jgi:hypothetical protein
MVASTVLSDPPHGLAHGQKEAGEIDDGKTPHP